MPSSLSTKSGTPSMVTVPPNGWLKSCPQKLSSICRGCRRERDGEEQRHWLAVWQYFSTLCKTTADEKRLSNLQRHSCGLSGTYVGGFSRNQQGSSKCQNWTPPLTTYHPFPYHPNMPQVAHALFYSICFFKSICGLHTYLMYLMYTYLMYTKM